MQKRNYVYLLVFFNISKAEDLTGYIDSKLSPVKSKDLKLSNELSAVESKQATWSWVNDINLNLSHQANHFDNAGSRVVDKNNIAQISIQNKIFDSEIYYALLNQGLQSEYVNNSVDLSKEKMYKELLVKLLNYASAKFDLKKVKNSINYSFQVVKDKQLNESLSLLTYEKLNEVELDLLDLEINKIEIESKLKELKNELKIYLKVAKIKDITDQLKMYLAESSIDSITNYLSKSNKLKQLKINEKLFFNSYKAQNAKKWGSLNISANYSYQRQSYMMRQLSKSDNYENNYSYSLSYVIPIFSVRNTLENEKKRLKHLQSQNNLNVSKEELKNEYKNVINEINMINKKIEISDKRLVLLKRLAVKHKKDYKLGLITSIEYLKTKKVYSEAIYNSSILNNSLLIEKIKLIHIEN